MQPEGCHAAQETLALALDRISHAYRHLRSWAEDLERIFNLAAEHLTSSEVQGFFVEDIVPRPHM